MDGAADLRNSLEETDVAFLQDVLAWSELVPLCPEDVRIFSESIGSYFFDATFNDSAPFMVESSITGAFAGLLSRTYNSEIISELRNACSSPYEDPVEIEYRGLHISFKDLNHGGSVVRLQEGDLESEEIIICEIYYDINGQAVIVSIMDLARNLSYPECLGKLVLRVRNGNLPWCGLAMSQIPIEGYIDDRADYFILRKALRMLQITSHIPTPLS